MRANALAVLVATALLGPATLAAGSGVTVGSGSGVDLGSARLDLGCGDLVVAGSFAAGTDAVVGVRAVSIAGTGSLEAQSASLDVAGSWSNAGSFSGGTSGVSFVDGCSVSSAAISGNTTFVTLVMSTAVGKLYQFEAGSTQTIEQSLVLMGAADNLLTLRSTLDGSEAFIDLQGGHTTDYVDVKDNHAIGNPIVLGANSVISGNADGWSFGSEAVPALSLGALGTLTLAMLWAACRRLRAA